MKQQILKTFVVALILTLGLVSAARADITRLYVGEMDGQFMTGLDSRVSLGPLYVGGDVRTLIARSIQDSSKYTFIGFAPERTDYIFMAGINAGSVNFEYASVCYHRVISSTDLAQYMNTVAIPNTQTFKVRLNF